MERKFYKLILFFFLPGELKKRDGEERERHGEGKWIYWQWESKRQKVYASCCTFLQPPYPPPIVPSPPGVFIHGDRLGNVSHLSRRGVNALLVVFIAVTRSKDEARDISKKSHLEIFEKPLLLRRRVATLCTGQSGAIFLSDFVAASACWKCFDQSH